VIDGSVTSSFDVRPKVLDGRQVGVHGLVEVDGEEPLERVPDEDEIEEVFQRIRQFRLILEKSSSLLSSQDYQVISTLIGFNYTPSYSL
jgi:hypothetical protein